MAPSNIYRKFGKIWMCCFKIYERTYRQTERHTNMLIAILVTPDGGEVK